MKKKIFLVSLMIAALMCLFAIFTSAEEIINSKTVSEKYGTVIQLKSDPGLDNASQYVSTLNEINDSGTDTEALCILTDGTYFYVFPSSYIVWEISGGKFEIYAGTESQPGLAQAMAEFNEAMKTSYYDDYVIQSTWGNRRLDEVVRFEFTTDVTWVDRDHCCMRSYPALKEVRIGHAINFSRARSMFSKSANLEKVIGFENVTGLENDTSYFQTCTKLNYVKLPASLTRMPNYIFGGCKALKSLESSHLTAMTVIGQSAFQDAMNVNFVLPDSVTTIEQEAFRSASKSSGTITINKTSQLTTIGVSAFNDCRTMGSIYIPSTVTTIGDKAFYQCYALKTVENLENCLVTSLGSDVFTSTPIESIRLPKGLQTLGTAFGNNEKLKAVYIPDTITSISNTFINQNAEAVYFFTGDDVTALKDCATIFNAASVKYDSSKEDSYYADIASASDAPLVVFSYNICKAFYNNVHQTVAEVDDHDCITDDKCRCKNVINAKTATEHVDFVAIVYTDYTMVGVKSQGCSNDGCTKYDVDVEVLPLFVTKGYSIKSDGRGITTDYEVNSKALDEYITYLEANEKSFEFGIFIGNSTTFGETFIKADGTVDNDYSFSQKVKADGFLKIKCTVADFTTDEATLTLAMGLYVIEDGKVSYIQHKGQDAYAGTVTKGETTLDVVTITKIAELTGIELALPAPKAVVNKED